jgi:hypothetical protein
MIKRLAIAALVVASPAFGQGVDPFIGTWKFNAEKSSCQMGDQSCPIMKSETLVVSLDYSSTVDNLRRL